MNRGAAEAFDVRRFAADVHRQRRRWGWTVAELAYYARLSPGNLRQVLSGTTGLSLLTACALAEVCDLSLDDYRRRPVKHRETSPAGPDHQVTGIFASSTGTPHVHVETINP